MLIICTNFSLFKCFCSVSSPRVEDGMLGTWLVCSYTILVQPSLTGRGQNHWLRNKIYVQEAYLMLLISKLFCKYKGLYRCGGKVWRALLPPRPIPIPTQLQQNSCTTTFSTEYGIHNTETNVHKITNITVFL